MKAEALQVIDQIVTRSNAGKKLLNPRSALLTRIVICVNHAFRDCRYVPQGTPACLMDFHGRLAQPGVARLFKNLPQVRQALAGNGFCTFIEIEHLDRNKAIVSDSF